MTQVLDAARLAHRAIVGATVMGLMGKAKRLAIVVGELGAIARAAPSAGHTDLVVTVDESSEDAAGIAKALDAARHSLSDDGILSLVVGSPVTAALIEVAASYGDAIASASATRDDAYADAVAWAALRARSARLTAPPVEPSRLALLVEVAARQGLTLVEPEIAVSVPGLGRVRGMKSPRARALLATMASGTSARPLFFVPSARAPKAGLLRAKVERLADGWVASGAAGAAEEASDAMPIVRAATAVLDDAACGGGGPMTFKELLREARERWSTDARANGQRATPSATDASDLAGALYRLAGDDRVELWMRDPAGSAMALAQL